MMESFAPTVAFFPCYDKIKQRTTPKVAAPKVSKGRPQTSSVFIALWSRPQARNPCLRKRAAWGRFCGSAKLLAGTLRCLHLCWRLPWDWSDAEQLGRCPKPQQGRCPCTLQGTLSLDHFLAPRLECASHAVPCRGFLPFSPLPYWNRDIISCGESPPTMDSPGLISWSNSAFFRCPSATTCSSIEACVTRRITSTLRVCPMRYARSVA